MQTLFNKLGKEEGKPVKKEKEDKTKVIFLVNEREQFGEDIKDLFAFFYKIKETNRLYLSYAHVGQHSTASMEYAKDSRLAKPSEYKDLKNELEGQGYNLKIAKSKSVLK